MKAFTGLFAVFKREFKSYFSSPMGYLFVVIFLCGSSYLMISRDNGRFVDLRQASLAPLFHYMPHVFLILIPAVAMRLWSEERRNGTVELLLTLPVTLPASYLGKFLAGWCFVGFALLCTFMAPIQVARLGSPDWPVIFSGYLSTFLLAGALLAIGMFFSAITKNQIIALICSVAVSLLCMIAGIPETLDWVSGLWGGSYLESVLMSLSILDHHAAMSRGVIEFGSVLFFIFATVAWLIAGMTVLKQTKAA